MKYRCGLCKREFEYSKETRKESYNEYLAHLEQTHGLPHEIVHEKLMELV